MTRSTRRLAALAATGLIALTAACGGGGGGDAEGAGDGLVVYSGRQKALVAPLLKDFTATTGIEVTARYGGSAELAAQLLEEGDASPADAFLSQDAGALGALQDAGRFVPLAQAQLDRVPARYRSRQGSWVGLSGRSRVLVYNPEQVPEAQLPKSVFDLVEPAYKGRVGYAPSNASFQTFVTGMRVSVGEERTREWLEGFKANEPKAFDGNIPIVEAVDSGELAMGLVNHYYLYEQAAEKGGLDRLNARNYTFPGKDPGSLVNVAGVGVLQGSDPRAARLVDFLLGSQAQTYFAEKNQEYPLVDGVAPPEGVPPLADLQGPDIDLSELDTLEQTLALLDEVGLT